MSILSVACGNTNSNEEQTGQQVDAVLIKQLVHDYSVEDFKGEVQASITSDELIVTNNNGDKEIYQLPEEEFFVSIAPYIEQTHP
ncbi:hypothetical protein BEP19_11830 [Ammoniphilus oxalaticus]|uniref:Uncharacterized protein n=2 Tax=Ammoniphilus oxalaticus TaxID=66863 RepID=A0A419SHH3_9BACL|nr:hypothetical protein BEP19_11830 [Ammoniphilus oxalaticus]